ncbi:hypothetical protein ACQEVF_49180 [Nonomuraea polychroma]|uniref:hypothetical protein n=1 Tax=Nonomuraea polychroma TaxID=46176 RepID=UPI003D8AB8B0
MRLSILRISTVLAACLLITPALTGSAQAKPRTIHNISKEALKAWCEKKDGTFTDIPGIYGCRLKNGDTVWCELTEEKFTDWVCYTTIPKA